MQPLLDNFCYELINNPDKFKGVVVEFGTGTSTSTSQMAGILTGYRILTFDGFVGLPETQKGIPTHTEWHPGNYCYDYEQTKEKLAEFHNVEVHKAMSWEIEDLKNYGVEEIAGVNIDFDLYEGSLDALRLLNNCTWKNILIRFDDWGAYPHQVAEEVDAHEKAAFRDWIAETGYTYVEYPWHLNIGGLQTVMEVIR